MKKIFLVFSVLFSLILVGCEKHKISRGIVVDKNMSPAYVSLIFNGKITVPVAHPATYRLSVKNNEITELFYVNEQKYSSVIVGDSVYFDDVQHDVKQDTIDNE